MKVDPSRPGMPEALRGRYERTVRIDAPVAAVWNEIATLDQLLARAPEVVAVVPHADPRRATFRARLVWGRFLAWNVDAEAKILEAVPRTHLLYTSDFPKLRAHYQGIFALAPGASDVTIFGYRGSFVCRHHFARLMTWALSLVMKDHVDTVTSSVARLAAQHTLFEETMAQRSAQASRRSGKER
jgi:hypothetical protein